MPLVSQGARVGTRKAIACKECGYSVAYLDATMQSMSYSDGVEFSCFSYKRINHFNEWLMQAQAKENYEVSMDVMNAVCAELFRQRVTCLDDITPQKVRKSSKSFA